MWTAGLEGASAILVASFPVMPRLYRFLRGERQGSLERLSDPSYEKRKFGSDSTGPERRPSARIPASEWTPATTMPAYGVGSERQDPDSGTRRQHTEGWYGQARDSPRRMGMQPVYDGERASEKPRGLRPIASPRQT